MINNRIKSNNNINDDVINDPRLFPLFENDTKLLFQLFVLELKRISTNEKKYKVIYGWCIKTTKEDIENKISCSNEFSKIHKSEDTVYSVAKISLYNYPPIIINIVNELLLGHSLENSCINNCIDTTKLHFDVSIFDEQNKNDIVLRPIIFNDTNTLISRNPYEKNTLISPYKNVSSFTLPIVNLNKESIVTFDKDSNLGEWQQGLLATLKYLQEETNLPFTSSGCTRFGNIEFINTQCSDEYEVHNVWHDTNIEEITIDYRKEICCRKIKVTIEPNIYTCSKNLIINCYFKNGEQIIFDECKNLFHKDHESITVEFESKEQIGSFSISIWKEEKEGFQIWYKDSAILLRQISTNMGVVEASGLVKSPWLDIIEKSNNKTIEKVREAEKVSKASFSTTTIGNYDLDPWVETDRSFSKLVNKLSPEKSDAEFFPKGWDSKDNQHGAISFLEWFKKITGNAQKVVIQDPFYGTVGLEFLVRTTNANTEFSILTCTQITSSDDDKANSEVTAEPNRALRIKSLVKSNPSLFDTLKLNIYDLRSTGGGDKNILHDRYILIFEGGELEKGFHLSNSIQGATRKNPMLITPIPKNILRKVDDHINEIIQQTVSGKDLKIVSLYDYKSKVTKKDKIEIKEISDEGLYEELKEEIASEEYVQKEIIDKFINSDSIQKSESFDRFWSTFGHFLAHVNYCSKILSIIEDNIDHNFIVNLRKYLEITVSTEYPIGFSAEKATYRDNNFQFLFNSDFEEIIRSSLTLEGHIHESISSRNWGAYYGSRLLLKADFDEFLKIIRFIQNQFNAKKNIDLANSSLLKLTNIVFTHLYHRLFWTYDESIIFQGIECNIPIIKAITTAALISKIIGEKDCIKFEDTKSLLIANLFVDDALNAFSDCLLNHRFWSKHNDSELETNILSVIYDLLKDNYSEERLYSFFNKALYSPYPLIEKKITEEIFLKLEENKEITANKIFELWTNEFIKLLNQFESYKDYAGIIDITGWSIYVVDSKTGKVFVGKLKKRFLKEVVEIRKPFSRGSEAWNNAFERVLLIRTLLIITVLYEAEKKSEYNEEMRNIINEIELLETNYKFSMHSYSKVYLFSKQMLEQYHDLSLTTL